MEGGEAFGGGKAGVAFDPLNFLKKPCVVFRIAALVSAYKVYKSTLMHAYETLLPQATVCCVLMQVLESKNPQKPLYRFVLRKNHDFSTDIKKRILILIEPIIGW